MFEIFVVHVAIYFLFLLGFHHMKVLWQLVTTSTSITFLNYFDSQEIFPDFMEKVQILVKRTFSLNYLLRHTNFTKLHFEKRLDICA